MIMKRRVLQRLQSKAGESIAEVLVALLIAAVALMMLASMISSTVSIVNKSKIKMDDYYTNNTVLELQTAPKETVSITIGSSDGAVSETPTVELYENETFNKKVYAYQITK